MNVFPEAHASDKKEGRKRGFSEDGPVLASFSSRRWCEGALISSSDLNSMSSSLPTGRAPRRMSAIPPAHKHLDICIALPTTAYATPSRPRNTLPVPMFPAFHSPSFRILDSLALGPSSNSTIAKHRDDEFYRDTIKRAQCSTSKLSGFIDNR